MSTEPRTPAGGFGAGWSPDFKPRQKLQQDNKGHAVTINLRCRLPLVQAIALSATLLSLSACGDNRGQDADASTEIDAAPAADAPPPPINPYDFWIGDVGPGEGPSSSGLSSNHSCA